jgi:hypothetical protein
VLDPGNRHLFLEALRPPAGYRLDRGVGTTYSLDLIALLCAPLAFTKFDWRDEVNGPPTGGPALLEALRENIERLVVFCQAGQIGVPRQYGVLFDYLEDVIVEVSLAEGQGVFHPKVWVLRYEPISPDSGVAPLIRFVCMSRNLTFAAMWDTMLVLDGEVAVERTRGFSVNRPLVDFVSNLPRMAKHALTASQREIIDGLLADLPRTRFVPPSPFSAFEFHPLGITRRSPWPLPSKPRRMLVVSPFLSKTTLKDITASGAGHVLVAPGHELAALGQETLGRFARIYELSDEALPEASDDEGSADIETAPLSGLHAKLYVSDEGWNARVWTGSANATWSAFNRNVEFLVELHGMKSECGVDRLLGLDSDPDKGMLRLLREFDPETCDGSAEAESPLEHALEHVRRALGAARLGAVVELSGEDTYAVRIENRGPLPLVEPSDVAVTLSVRPITSRESHAQALDPIGASSIVFADLSFDRLTAFFAVEATARLTNRKASTRFVLHLPLEGAPEGRREAVVRRLLREPEDVLRFLLLLLSDDPFEFLAAGAGPQAGAAMIGPLRILGFSGSALLEPLLKALAAHPEKLDTIASLIAELRSDEDERDPLPAGFDSIWKPVWEARGDG